MPGFSQFPSEFFRRFFLLIGATFILAGCSESPEPLKSPPVAVTVVKLHDTEVRPSRDFVARTAASARADLTARIEAEIKQILFVEGSQVKQGQVLIKLEDTRVSADLQQSRAELSAARSELTSAQRNLKRGEDVAGKGYLSDADLDKLKDRFNVARNRLKTAEAAMQIAEVNLDYAVIKSPFDGWIGRQNYDVGAVVSPASRPIADVLVTDPIYVEFQLDESDYVAFRRAVPNNNEDASNGLSLHLTLPDGGRYNQSGKLSFTDVQVDASTGTVAMRAVFTNPNAVLLPGLYVTLQIEGAAGSSQVLVPQMAIQKTIEGIFVLVVDDQNTVSQRFIKTGPRVGAMLAVDSGLESGEQVIVEGLQKVRSGVEVKPIIRAINPETGVLTEVTSNAAEARQ